MYESKPTKFVFQQFYGDEEITISFAGDTDIYETVDKFRQFLIAAGFHPDTVKKAIPDDEALQAEYDALVAAVRSDYEVDYEAEQ